MWMVVQAHRVDASADASAGEAAAGNVPANPGEGPSHTAGVEIGHPGHGQAGHPGYGRACHAGGGDAGLVFPIPHGADPLAELAARGLRVLAWSAAQRTSDGQLTVRCTVADLRPGQSPAPVQHPVPHAAGLVIAPGEVAVPVQRVSALVIVRVAGASTAGPVLLTRYSARTRRPGHWGLPGGGLDPAEEPVDAARRECWEETGHRVDVGPLLGVASDHFVGRAPSGRLEDFHAIHLVYAGTCAEAVDPVVHDLDGSTDGAAWVAIGDLAALPLSPMARRHLAFAGVRVGGAPGGILGGTPGGVIGGTPGGIVSGTAGAP